MMSAQENKNIRDEFMDQQEDEKSPYYYILFILLTIPVFCISSHYIIKEMSNTPKTYDTVYDWINNNDFSRFDKFHMKDGDFLRIKDSYTVNDDTMRILDTEHYLIVSNKLKSNITVYSKYHIEKGTFYDMMYADTRDYFTEATIFQSKVQCSDSVCYI